MAKRMEGKLFTSPPYFAKSKRKILQRINSSRMDVF